jgi:hypothetical protein
MQAMDNVGAQINALLVKPYASFKRWQIGRILQNLADS